jgi:predicted GIY-YIG superfamily endonuclease
MNIKKQTDVGDSPKHYHLYILKLVDQKYYVGITSMTNPNKRIAQHQTGYFSSQWTKKYKPIETLEIRSLGNITFAEAQHLENVQTLEFMKQYGYQDVRGGKFNYSGKYYKVGDRYFRDQDFKTLLVVSFMTFALLVASVKLV